MKVFGKRAPLSAYCLVLSLYTVFAFHGPFFRHVLSQVDGGANAVLITAGAFLILAALDYLLYYVLVFAGRFVGRCIVAFTLFGDAVMLYFVNNYQVLVTDEMMGNVFNTQYSEASGFFSFSFVLYILLYCVVPCLYVFGRKVDYGSWKRFLGQAGLALGVTLAAVFGNMKNWPWIDRNSTELGALLMPWSYTVNSFRYWDAQKKKDVEEILLPDPVVETDTPQVCVLIIGESARRDHFSLYGYGKETNPYTAKDTVTALPARASATYTTAGVKAILEPFESGDLYEILPNYLQRAGVDVAWRTSNWGEPPVHTEKYFRKSDLKARFPSEDETYDGILLAGLADDLRASEADKVFVVLHAYTNHGPSYNTNYPPGFEVFTPVCNTVEMARTSREELLNAYDNSVVYTDWIVHSVIATLRDLPLREGCVLYVSDHGESLGENNLYMHGVPMAMAPKEQIEIPFVVWTSSHRPVKDGEVGHYHVFHSVLDFLGIGSPVFDKDKSVFVPQDGQ